MRSILVLISMWMALAGGSAGYSGGSVNVMDMIKGNVASVMMGHAAYAAPVASMGQKVLPGELLYSRASQGYSTAGMISKAAYVTPPAGAGRGHTVL